MTREQTPTWWDNDGASGGRSRLVRLLAVLVTTYQRALRTPWSPADEFHTCFVTGSCETIVQRLIDVDLDMFRGAGQAEVDREIGRQWNVRVLVIGDAVRDHPHLAYKAVRCAKVTRPNPAVAVDPG